MKNATKPSLGDLEDALTSLSGIRPSPLNPRKHFDDDDIRELADHIKIHGLLVRLLVRPIAKKGQTAELGANGQWTGLSHFELVDGERRWRALKLNNTKNLVKVTVKHLTDEQALAIMLVTRTQSRDLLPSEKADGYARLAAMGKTAEQIAEQVAEPVKFVRSLLKLGGLPEWAMRLVDDGTLPRAIAELVARVPGMSRERCAAQVVIGSIPPLSEADGKKIKLPNIERWVKQELKSARPLTYDETRSLIRERFTVELKGAPFDRHALNLVPETPSCDDCPQRAGNDPDAKAEGVRADVCLDPECYRAKVAAHKMNAEADAAAKGIPLADLGVSGLVHPPKGWCRLDTVIWQTELNTDFPVGPKQNPKREEKLGKVLGKACPQQYLAFAHNDQPVFLVKTPEARKALVSLGVLKKEEKRKVEKSKPVKPAPSKNGKPAGAVGPSQWDIDLRAADIGAEACRTMLLANAESLATIGQAGGPDTDAVYQALSFVARVVIRDWLDVGQERAGVIVKQFPGLPSADHPNEIYAPAAKRLGNLTPAEMVGFLFAATSHVIFSDTRKDATFRDELLAYADTTWEACREKARAELVAEQNPKEVPAMEPPVRIGDVVRTSYGTGPYVVKHTSTVFTGKNPVVSLTLRNAVGADKSDSYLNDYSYLPDGRFIAKNGDEFIVIPDKANPGLAYWDWCKAAGIDGSMNDQFKRRWMNGEPPPVAAKAEVPAPAPRKCRVCGCTEDNCLQCIEKTGEPCSWVEGEPDLCTACANEEDAKIGAEMKAAAEPDTSWRELPIEDLELNGEVVRKLRLAKCKTLGQAATLLHSGQTFALGVAEFGELCAAIDDAAELDPTHKPLMETSEAGA